MTIRVASVSHGPSATVTVHVPMKFRRIGGRKTIIAPAVEVGAPTPSRKKVPTTDPILRALGRARYWGRLLDSGEYGSLAELAAAEKVDKSYLSKVLRLNLLAPDIIEAIVSGDVTPGVSMAALIEPFPHAWKDQRAWFGH